MKWISFFALLLATSAASAGYVELSATGNFHTNTVNDYTYQKTQSLTASIAYYFWEMSAFELSYTDSISRSWGRTAIANTDYVETSRVQLYGADIMISLGGRQAVFRPYIKIGGAQQLKTWIYEEGLVNSRVDSLGFSTTGGLGFRYMLTEEFALKAGIDGWTTPGITTVDYAANAGISWMF